MQTKTVTASSFSLLHPDLPRGCWLEQSDENPLRFAVWSPEGDIIGASDDEDEAISEARETVLGWVKTDVERSIELGGK